MMKISRLHLILVAVAILVLAACVRNVPGAVKPAPTQGGEETGQVTGQAVGSTPGALNQIFLFATQTAMATQGVMITPQPPTNVEPTQAVAAGDTPAPAIVQPTPEAPQVVAPNPVVELPPTPETPNSYTLKSGEFPYCIARRYNVNPSDLMRVNGLSSFSVYYAGMVLQIPQTGGGFPGQRALRPHPTTYTVRTGDTIYSVACIFGDVHPESIAAVNGLAAPYKLTPGQVISIP